MALWPGRRDEDEQPGETGGGRSDPLHELTERLGELGKLLEQTNRQVVAYLIERQSPVAGAEDSALLEKLDALIDKVDRLAAAGPATDAPSGTSTAAELGEAIGRLQQRLDAGLQELADRLREEEPDESNAGPDANADWQRAILGAELAEHPRLGAQRRRLLDGALAGDPDARSLLGQLLVFRSAAADRMPPLLKDLGEAYYRWQPKTSATTDPMEQALVDWLGRTLQEAGISNSIELVHPGERFDAARHTAATRGVEITEVRGWIVLRDNGRVYTKANVAAR